MINNEGFNNENLLDCLEENEDQINEDEFSTTTLAPSNCCCNETKDANFLKCEISHNTDMDVNLNCLGRLLRVNVKINNVCPNKKIAIGVLVLEGNKLAGFRAKEIYTGNWFCGECKCINGGEFCFVFEENNLCSSRHFKVRIIAHYTNL